MTSKDILLLLFFLFLASYNVTRTIMSMYVLSMSPNNVTSGIIGLTLNSMFGMISLVYVGSMLCVWLRIPRDEFGSQYELGTESEISWPTIGIILWIVGELSPILAFIIELSNPMSPFHSHQEAIGLCILTFVCGGFDLILHIVPLIHRWVRNNSN
jgi:hypothetical protein